MDPTKPITFHVAGVQHRGDDPDALIRAGVTFPLACSIVGEPKNAYDRYAVKVMVGILHLGYVPKPVNIDVWSLHDAGYKAIGTIINHNPDQPLWRRFEVQVVFEKKGVTT